MNIRRCMRRTVEDLILNELCKDMAVSPSNLCIEKLDVLSKNGTICNGMEAVSKLRLHSHQSMQGKPRTAGI